MTRSTTLTVLAVAVFALAGCIQSSPGTATTSPTGSGGQPTSAGSPSGGTTGVKPVAGLDPCTLLTSGEIAQLGLPSGQKEDLGGQRGCVWNVTGRSGYSVSVGIRETQGIKDIQSQAVRTSGAPVGKHEARLLEEPGNTPGSCMAVLGVTSSSRVDIIVQADVTAQACQVANQVATKVEPKLP